MADTIATRSELRWLASHSTSCLHAAEAMCRGLPLVDGKLAAAIAQPAEGLYRDIRAAGLPSAHFWRHLIGLSPGIDDNQQLAELAVKKTIGSTPRLASLSSRLASWIGTLENAVVGAIPRLVDQLALRAGPLRSQWEARGAGMLRRVAELTDAQVLVTNADVVLVHPALGGGGRAHLPYNCVRIEAVLANPIAELPEMVRLGWLIAQLNLDLPALSETIPADRLPLVAEMAMLPAILLAAEHVELLRFNQAVMESALAHWNIVTPPDFDPVDVLTRWWGTYQETRPPLRVALTALDRMIG